MQLTAVAFKLARQEIARVEEEAGLERSIFPDRYPGEVEIEGRFPSVHWEVHTNPTRIESNGSHTIALSCRGYSMTRRAAIRTTNRISASAILDAKKRLARGY